MNEILSVEYFNIRYYPDTNTVIVKAVAVVGNMKLIRKQTLEDPEEWGPAKCETVFELNDEDKALGIIFIQESMSDLLDDYDCEWKLCESKS